MILKYQRPERESDDDTQGGATQGNSNHVVSGVDNYDFGYFKKPDKDGEREMYITYHLVKDVDDKWHSVTIRSGCSAFIMTNEGKTIERIR